MKTNPHHKIRVVSAMRPTGRLHLGHFHGVLKNWLKLQDLYECFFFVADLHGLTTEYSHPQIIKESTQEILMDWLSIGLDPKKSVIFIQSHIQQHAELHLVLSMITPLGWLERVPSYKEMQQELSTRDLSTYGFLGYPLLQTADVALYNGEKVPVGLDQVPHIELSREIVRRFNHLYGETLKEPQPLLTETPKLLGPDRRKMSKSYNNCIYLNDTPEDVEKKIMSAITDPARVRRDDPGNPDVCLIFDYHKLHSSPEHVSLVAQQCRTAKLGCIEDKKEIITRINNFLDPIRKRREDWQRHQNDLKDIINLGTKRAREVAEETMSRVKKSMGYY